MSAQRHRKSSASGPVVHFHNESQSQRARELLTDAATKLRDPPSTNELLAIVSHFDDLSQQQHASAFGFEDPDESALEQSVALLVTGQVYQKLLQEVRHLALEAEDEAEWWAGVQRGDSGVAYFLLQTLPQRLIRLGHTVLHTMNSHDPPLSLASLRPDLIRKLFPFSPRPSALFTALFPHLANSTNATWYLQTPVQLVRGECSQKRIALETMRDSYAEKFARLHAISSHLMPSIIGASATGAATPDEGRLSYPMITTSLNQIYGVFEPDALALTSSNRGVFGTARILLGQTLPGLKERHTTTFTGLKRPSRLVLAWPRLILGPPLILLVGRSLYRSRDSLWQMFIDSGETVRSFWRSYVIEPIVGILNTVRTGGDEGMRIISKEGLKSDLDSLERMVISLSTEKFSYTPEQVAQMSEQIRAGDLTEVMKLYENDIKHPVRSAITGTLIRTLLIQIQKTKVDIDFALTGIDKLLRSQELTFEFVGVAPALAVVYVFVGWVRQSLAGTRGRGRFGGRFQRARAFDSIRRVERLLLAPPPHHHHHHSQGYPLSESAQAPPSPASSEHTTSPAPLTDLAPLTSGLLLLALTRLRSFASTYLPVGSRLRDGFLADVADLEDPRLGRAEKLRVVERMWRSWGDADILGWKRSSIEF
ncbi:Nuclear control of ATPase protein 2 OS=Schizosaccharomyces pombe (strain 972 / ATCC 24843) GN=nca2 PE=3 SV=1 [Rhizoctonia solani AG-1 IB]|uniref:Nuclear control of ATPase protein 2 n=1 Tax=Thanatephorus cucumeris (strain AG1-IB / isolate 7/3/14) TaxID=1108050 RepID=A0A0B7FWZ5_THACB|nr:Nuclear control of ATPase protein 2 OS=Schizosaccharomyces pombe (strain 972 / ATCC 24843) GN=nca2 PE=3 SV=1 [Rhizoctonia solani AG-1 IB]